LSDDLDQSFHFLVDILLLFSGIDEERPSDESVIAAVHGPKSKQDAIGPELFIIALSEQFTGVYTPTLHRTGRADVDIVLHHFLARQFDGALFQLRIVLHKVQNLLRQFVVPRGTATVDHLLHLLDQLPEEVARHLARFSEIVDLLPILDHKTLIKEIQSLHLRMRLRLQISSELLSDLTRLGIAQNHPHFRRRS